MKRSFLLSVFCLMTIMSCRTNDNAESLTKTTQNIQALKDFNSSLLKTVKAEDDPKSPKRNPMELSDYKKRMLLPAAKELIISSGVSADELKSVTNDDMNEIIDWAVEVYDNGGKSVNHKIKNN